jgi:hypothetical protein
VEQKKTRAQTFATQRKDKGGSMPTILVNPLDETIHEKGAPAARLDSLKGKIIGLLDISKPGGSVFLDRLEQLLKDRHNVASVVRASKPTFAKPAPQGVIDSLIANGVDAVVEALAD